MIARPALRLWTALAATTALAGCATPSDGATAAKSCADLGDPGRLEEQAHVEIAAENFELAYRYVALIHMLHPESAQNREVFPLAARLYRINWAPHRTEVDSIWVTSEPQFMIAWVAGFFSDGPREFPQEQMDALFLGMNYGLFRDFLAYAHTHPRLSQWVITAEKDNGIVEKISGSRR